MLDATKIDEYIGQVSDLLGQTWMIEADNIRIGKFHTIASITKTYAMQCYLASITTADCVKRIQAAFPEKEDG